MVFMIGQWSPPCPARLSKKKRVSRAHHNHRGSGPRTALESAARVAGGDVGDVSHQWTRGFR